MSTQTNTNLFETATREKYRFASAKGDLTVEELWDLPLTATVTNRMQTTDLDNIALQLDDQLSKTTEKSFVRNVKKENVVLKNKLEIVKYIISVKMEEANVKALAKAKASELANLDTLIAQKQNEALQSKSLDELLAERNRIAQGE